MKSAIDYTLYLVLDPDLCGDRNPLEITAQALVGGVSTVQLRAPNRKKREMFELAMALKPVLAEWRVPLIINDEIDVALACNAEGAHIGQSDLPPEEARRLLGEDAILGLSVSFRHEMQAAIALPTGMIDYVGIGPAFPTGSKLDANPVTGVEGLVALTALSPYPVVAIGGIDVAGAAKLAPTGIKGIAVISAICSSTDPTKASQNLRHAFLTGKMP